MEKQTDVFGRSFKTLRISLTNTCNLACVYCVDPETKGTNSAIGFPIKKTPLQTADFIAYTEALHRLLDLKTIRLTGGEPTLYKELIPLIEGLHSLNIPEIKMTTNGHLLGRHAAHLKKAGLKSVNISLDALDENVFYAINKRHTLQKTLEGIEAAVHAGLEVKINCVVMKGINDNQITRLLAYSKARNIRVRFLELMQMGHLHHNFKDYFFSEKDILQTLSKEYSFTEVSRDQHATAKYWVMEDGYSFGIISNESDPFCDDCNRLRLDSYGNIFGCLSDQTAINMADGLNDELQLKACLQQALAQKKLMFSGSPLSMQHVGG
jgi:cyclic pyranopterin phosphate synthase